MLNLINTNWWIKKKGIDYLNREEGIKKNGTTINKECLKIKRFLDYAKRLECLNVLIIYAYFNCKYNFLFNR